MSSKATIEALLGSAPPDLVAYFYAGHFRVRSESRINCLGLEAAATYTTALVGVGLGSRLGLFALDDAEDSNPYCYISRGPCAGAVFHLCHDGACAIQFSSLSSFLTALDALPKDQDIHFDLRPEADIVFDVVPAIEQLISAEDADMDMMIPVYLPVARGLSSDLRSRLATCSDFFVREAFAIWLRDFGTREDLPLAQNLASDSMSQVARPAQQAVARLRRP